jgi:hypothetical protein
MYKTVKKMIDVAVKVPDGTKDKSVAEAFGLTVSDLNYFAMMLMDIKYWVEYSNMTLNKRAYSVGASSLFHKMFVPDGLSGKLYYANKAKKINHQGSLIGKTIIRKRKSGIMNWSYAAPVHYAEGYILETKVPKLQHVILANIDQPAVTRCIKAIIKARPNYRDKNSDSIIDVILELLRTLKSYGLEREVITVGLPEVRCKVVGYKK